MLDGKSRTATVNGKVKHLNKSQYKVIEALVKYRPLGMTLESLQKISGDARGILTRMRDKNDEWASVIHMAEAPGGRYSID
jgi:hypothetical protein